MKLYDTTSILDTPRDIAHGFVILLSGGSLLSSPTELLKRKKSRFKLDRNNKSNQANNAGNEQLFELVDENSLTLAFIALTDGNVIDASLGAPYHRLSNTSPSTVYRQSQVAKSALVDASDTSDSICQLAVETYHKAFLIVVEYHDRVGDLSCCSRCVTEEKIYRRAEIALKESFEPLIEAVTHSTCA